MLIYIFGDISYDMEFHCFIISDYLKAQMFSVCLEIRITFMLLYLYLFIRYSPCTGKTMARINRYPGNIIFYGSIIHKSNDYSFCPNISHYMEFIPRLWYTDCTVFPMEHIWYILSITDVQLKLLVILLYIVTLKCLID